MQPIKQINSIRQSIILVVVCFFCVFSFVADAQTSQCYFADSLQLSSPPWSGTLERFTLTEGALWLHDATPNSQGNHAYLSRSYPLTPQMSWSASLMTTVKPSAANRMRWMLYVVEQSDENDLKTAVAIQTNREGGLSLVHLLVQCQATEWQVLRTETLSSTPTTPLSGGGCVDFYVTKTANGLWSLYLRNEGGAYQLSGRCSIALSAPSPQAYLPLQIDYTKTRANAFAVRSMTLANELIDPTVDDGEGFIDASTFYGAINHQRGELISVATAVAIDQPRLVALLDENPVPLTTYTVGRQLYIRPHVRLITGTHQLTLKHVHTRTGDRVTDAVLSFTVTAMSLTQRTRQLHFNEVMANPLPGSCEYIELVNLSDLPLDLSDYSIAFVKEGKPNYWIPLSDAQQMVPVGAYVVLAVQPQLLAHDYDVVSAALIPYSAMPQLPNKGFTLLLRRNTDFWVADTLKYTTDLYPQGLKTKRGVALERESVDHKVWRPALPEANYATPTRANSVSNMSQFDESASGVVTMMQQADAWLRANDGHCTLTVITLTGERALQIRDASASSLIHQIALDGVITPLSSMLSVNNRWLLTIELQGGKGTAKCYALLFQL